jgi:methylenetetrahydrofolate reductase (NADPH)
MPRLAPWSKAGRWSPKETGMKVIEHILNTTSPRFSFEIVPPPRGRSIRDLVDVVESLLPLNPTWIDVTSHASTVMYFENPDGTVFRRYHKKRPGTIGICGVIQNRFKIDTVAHLLCHGFTREETEDALIELNFLGIENILALQGDKLNFDKPVSANRTVNHHASDLVQQVAELRKGQYLDQLSEARPLNVCVGVAGYPEKHVEAPNMKIDIINLKKKVDAGADYIVSQMFFDNRKFFEFVRQCREVGITVPIIPGLKIIRSINQLKTIPRTFHADLPEVFVDEMIKNPQHVPTIGQRWATQQVEDLLSNGINSVHFYVMNDTKMVHDVVKPFLK